MSFAQVSSRQPIIDVVAEEVDVEALPRAKASINREIARFGARLSELLTQETPHDLLGRLAEFKRSVDEPLRRSSSAYRLLRQLEESGSRTAHTARASWRHGSPPIPTTLCCARSPKLSGK